MSLAHTCDLLVIGGGINGVGIAADAAGRGLNVVLCEMDDLSSGTSSYSSRLIHGGIRYLENAEFRLVTNSLLERKNLKQNAEHLIKNQSFIMPHVNSVRPYPLIKLGVFIYDHLIYDPTIPRSGEFKNIADLELSSKYKKALQYFDCKTDDSRLVIHVALLAKQHGAEIRTRTKVTKALKYPTHWEVTTNNDDKIHTKVIVNATGPWASEVASQIFNANPQYMLNLVQGSHIIVPKLFTHDHALILQTEDKRVVFVIPYLDNFSLIGTTEKLIRVPISHPKPGSEEINYLITTINHFCSKKISEKDIVHSYAGLRPLVLQKNKNMRTTTRDYALEFDGRLMHVFGGKLTTYRKLAENAINKISKQFPKAKPKWTKHATLPGGYFPDGFEKFRDRILTQHPNESSDLIRHYLSNYGTSAELLLRVSKGKFFGGLLYQNEVDYLIKNEWAQSAEDILWRRGKMGLFLDLDQQQKLENYIASML